MFSDQYPTLRFTELSGTVLKGTQSILIRRQKKKTERSIRTRSLPETETYPEVLFNMLREKRLEPAQAEHLPAYCIIDDATLKRIAARQPLYPDKFLLIKGIGERRKEKYADLFIQVIQYYQELPGPIPSQESGETD